MVGYKREILALDSSTTTFTPKSSSMSGLISRKNNNNMAITTILSLFLFLNGLKLLPGSFQYSLPSTLPHSTVSKTFSQFSSERFLDLNRNKENTLPLPHTLTQTQSLTQTLPQAKKEATLVDRGQTGIIQNRLVHYGVYCGPGPADAFSGIRIEMLIYSVIIIDVVVVTTIIDDAVLTLLI